VALVCRGTAVEMSGTGMSRETAAVEMSGTGMSRDSVRDQFVCRIWLTRLPLWALLVTSTYGILLTALERYFAVVHHIWYKVRTTTSTQPCIPPGSLNRVPASAGVKAGMSSLPGGR